MEFVSPRERIIEAAQLMSAFAERTGLQSGGRQRRYLWTDAFAVGNFLGLAGATGQQSWAELALRLVDGVHQQLGRHRSDDPRVGWLSGLAEREGEAHPTCGGLRIGKRLPERRADQPFDEALEWDRDGQYFHYLTRWMHALSQTARSTGLAVFAAWARELGRAAHDGFVWTPPDGGKRMHWKMSIDLSRPLVPSMGQHDALDGYVACVEAEAVAARLSAGGPSIGDDANDFLSMVELQALASTDPLGTGALLADARVLDEFAPGEAGGSGALMEALLAAALSGVVALSGQGDLRAPPDRRLAFRELGLAIGLSAAALMRQGTRSPADGSAGRAIGGGTRRVLLEAIGRHDGLAESIVSFWLENAHQQNRSWSEHRDINEVMLATALVPQGMLSV
jgi:hypothetical protein